VGLEVARVKAGPVGSDGAAWWRRAVLAGGAAAGGTPGPTAAALRALAAR